MKYVEIEIATRRVGQKCWNLRAFRWLQEVALLQEVDSKDESSTSSSELAAVVSCNGCVINQNSQGTFCTAEISGGNFDSMTQTDRFGALKELPDFSFMEPGSDKRQVDAPETATPPPREDRPEWHDFFGNKAL